MGRKKGGAADGEAPPGRGLDLFAAALRRQLEDKKRRVRAFDVGGSGVKTSLLWATALRDSLTWEGQGEEGVPAAAELSWIERPTSLGMAPGEAGFAAWLQGALPVLEREVEDASVCFGVSVGGDVDHATGVLNDWWPAGGHPRSWDDPRRSPLVADIMGLPAGRTFALHDGEAHLLGCSRRLLPPPRLGCLAIGTGVGFGLTDDAGAVVDPCSATGSRSLQLNGAPLSGAPYRGLWRQWLEQPAATSAKVEEVMAKEFANMARPWRSPWVSLVLGRRGMELAEAAFQCPEPGCGPDPGAEAEARAPAVRAYGEQWLHFLQTQFVPQMCVGTRRHPVEQLCFSGGVAEQNWAALQEVLLEPGTSYLRSDSGADGQEEQAGRSAPKRGKGPQLRGGGAHKAAAAAPRVSVLPVAPAGSGLIGASLYALAGMGGAAAAVWAR